MVFRTSDLKRLEKIFFNNQSNFVFLYGRQGSEMTRLLFQFMKEKNCFYYRARQSSKESQFNSFVKVYKRYFDSEDCNSYEACFNNFHATDDSKMLLVIDEAQHILKSDEEFFSSLLKLYNKQLVNQNVCIVLASSSVIWAEQTLPALLKCDLTVFDEVIKLENLSFLDIVRSFPNYNVSECVSLYGIVGGVPSYLNKWDSNKSIKQNVCELILDPEGDLFNEIENYISTEFRELSGYNTILESIAAGNEKLNDLYKDTTFDRAKLAVYLKKLDSFDVVKKVDSFGIADRENAKKGVYRIVESLINFWFRFVYPHLTDLYLMDSSTFYDNYIKTEFNNYLDVYFVNVCREYLLLLNSINKLPVKLDDIGTWLGKENTIDIVGKSKSGKTIAGLCNWHESCMNYGSYEQLLVSIEQAKLKADIVYLFSATSFDQRLIDEANSNPAIILVDMTEL